ncbi:hypothetical protein FB451DRAFT_1050601 [Mycena latifolia]|nr:hypothetical protein FB451DRAFT_1050601 [Mycena latifolia]
MRQTKRTPEDDKLRTALENMRYGACTPEDIEFLESRIAGFRPENPKLNTRDFRDVSIITARNSQKDALNQMGARRFAEDTNQTLVDFCSVDRISARSVDKAKWKGCVQSEIKKMTKSLQTKLWDAPPCTTNEFIPGKLSLCLGMPVMLRSNDATEMCITKGQEGLVVGWDESVGPIGQRILDTLFVQLVKPPRNIQVEGLPPNIVPLVRTVTHITVLLADDTLLSVLREQVVALLNFGMTDYTSQGKSREHNPVELANCKDHRSYYVALSRGFTAKGTIIVQGFTAKKITSGISGYLRQELRELEILDEITRLRCEGLLPRTVTGLYRRRLIRSFYAWKSNHADPAHFHPAMRWNSTMGPRIPEAVPYSEWRPSITQSKKRKNPAVSVDSAPKRVKKEENQVAQGSHPERSLIVTADEARSSNPRRIPSGLIWDSRNHSCAYDATLTILLNLWSEDHLRWSRDFTGLSRLMGVFALGLRSVVQGTGSLEQARDEVRWQMNAMNPEDFPYGPNPCSIDRIASMLFPSKPYAIGRQSCPACGFADPINHGIFEATMSAGLSARREYASPVRIQEWFTNYLAEGRQNCPACRLNNIRTRLVMLSLIRDVPPVILLDINHPRLSFDRELGFDCNGSLIKMKLRGIVYGGQGHFTCRFIDAYDAVWFHDGITTGRRCLQQQEDIGSVDMMGLHRCGEKHAVAVIYARTN